MPCVEDLNGELSSAGLNPVDHTEILRGILSGCGDCIKILSLDGQLLFMSEGGKRVMEVDDFAVLQGCAWPSFWPAEGNQKAADAVQKARGGQVARFRGPATTAKGTPRYWDVQVSPIFDSAGKPTHLLSISRDITEEWEADERQRLLTEELKHRVKNTLASVMAIAHQTFRDSDPALRETFNMRLRALGNAYDALSNTDWAAAPIRSIVEGVLGHLRSGEGRFSIKGPKLELPPRQGLALALVINELATNAMKYGALSSLTGNVDISWSHSDADHDAKFGFIWSERGGPPAARPSRTGFGTKVINALVADDFGGEAKFDYTSTGLTCTLTSPMQFIPEVSETALAS
jgi:PAS domain S-box-containing protein